MYETIAIVYASEGGRLPCIYLLNLENVIFQKQNLNRLVLFFGSTISPISKLNPDTPQFIDLSFA